MRRLGEITGRLHLALAEAFGIRTLEAGAGSSRRRDQGPRRLPPPPGAADRRRLDRRRLRGRPSDRPVRRQRRAPGTAFRLAARGPGRPVLLASTGGGGSCRASARLPTWAQAWRLAESWERRNRDALVERVSRRRRHRHARGSWIAATVGVITRSAGRRACRELAAAGAARSEAFTRLLSRARRLTPAPLVGAPREGPRRPSRARRR